jgi:hypothetical protein
MQDMGVEPVVVVCNNGLFSSRSVQNRPDIISAMRGLAAAVVVACVAAACLGAAEARLKDGECEGGCARRFGGGGGS